MIRTLAERALAPLLLLLLAASPALAARPLGAYHGQILVAGQALGIQVTFRGDSTEYGADIDIPQQGAKGLPLVNVRWDEATAHVHFELPAMQGIATFEGAMAADTLAGTFTQAGFSGAFGLRPGALQPPAPPQDEEPITYRVDEVKVPSSGAVLAGTLTLPQGKGPFPAMVLVTGSGAQNRDEELFGFRPFRAIADRLTRAGVAVLRTDDRGFGGSTGNFARALTDTFVADALAGVSFLKARADVDPARIGILGHSEGGLVGPMAAVSSPDVAFLVLLAGPALRGDSLLFLQGQAIGKLDGATTIELQEAAVQQRLTYRVMRGDTAGLPELRSRMRASLAKRLEQMPAGSRPTGADAKNFLDHTLDTQLRQLDQPWFRRFVDLDPAAYVPKTRCPILALYGQKDCQVPPVENSQAMEKLFGAAQGGVERRIMIVPGVNHLFEECATGSPSEYGKLKNRFAPGVLDTLAHWVTRIAGVGAH